MRRHASLDELADLDAGVLRPRQMARISQHVAGCSECAHLSSQISAVPQLLSAIQYPAIPEHVSGRIAGALASEASTRLAEQAPTEVGRRELATERRRHRRHRSGQGWHLPGMSPLVSRLVTAAGALVILAGGGYAIAAGIGQGASNSGSSTASGPAAGSGSAAQTVGPRVNYGHSNAERSIQTVSSNENFVRATLAVQAEDAVRKARLEGVHSGPASGTRALPDNGTSTSASNGPVGSSLDKSQVRACVDAVAADRTVILIEFARFEGKPATIIVAAADGSRPAHVWAVGPACSAGSTDVLAQQTIGHV